MVRAKFPRIPHEVASRKLFLAQETFAVGARSPCISHEVASRKPFLAQETFAILARIRGSFLEATPCAGN